MNIEELERALLTEQAVNLTLTNNMKELYQRGVLEGSVLLLNRSASNLEKVAGDDKCPEELKAGFVEAANYLKAIATGKPFELRAKPEVPTAGEELAKAKEKFKKFIDPVVQEKHKTKSQVNPAARI